jgi:hypothetical protein
MVLATYVEHSMNKTAGAARGHSEHCGMVTIARAVAGAQARAIVVHNLM